MPDSSSPEITLRGERVALGPLHAGLLPSLRRWENDPLTVELGGESFSPRTAEQVAMMWVPRIRDPRPGWYGFAIYRLPDLLPIGHANIRDVGTEDRTAEFGITIGEPAMRGLGLGTEATRLLLHHAFTALDVHNIWLDTISVNHAAIGAYRAAGFREIGRIRNARRFAGRAVDMVLMECLATEFLTEQSPAATPRQNP